ncbi:hypothetical protein FHL15_011399 [Xylaria flabelliformis]|uniref:Peptidase S1 domain-containing protein n=1 Tax=Xylaria flabelliformis TaxID=2512241 RepID=A0A553HIC2_9PEZI|nr:hypothetical protein FHL15_011399 [Xylaria flabelliformis]
MDPAIVSDYDKIIQPKFLAILRSIKGLAWTSFILDNESHQYKLDITTQDPSNSKWAEASTALQKAFLDLTHRKLRVNVVKSKTFEEMRFVVPRSPQPYDASSKNPFALYSLGRSIGVEQLDYPGTLGGIITVTTGDKSRVYGLTNNHVVNIGKTTNTQPRDPTHVETGNVIYCPNYHDLEATKIQLKNTKLKNYKIAQLRAASGRSLIMPARATYPCIVDWALLQLNSQTLNNMLDEIPKLKANFQLHRTPQEKEARPFPAQITYDPNVHLVNGMTVFKWGRTTGITSGEVKMVRSMMNIDSVETWKGKIHNPQRYTEVAELVVGPRRGVPFCDSGDSGSLVVDERGHVVGLLWARADDDVIVTDIRVVFESIREKMEWGPNAVVSFTPNF